MWCRTQTSLTRGLVILRPEPFAGRRACPELVEGIYALVVGADAARNGRGDTAEGRALPGRVNGSRIQEAKAGQADPRHHLGDPLFAGTFVQWSTSVWPACSCSGVILAASSFRAFSLCLYPPRLASVYHMYALE